MKKIVLGIALACSLISCGNSSTKLFWRNANWDNKLDNSFVFKRNIKEDSINVYYRNNEKLCVGTESMDSVEYFFYKDNLMKVVVYFTESKTNVSKLTNYFILTYGKTDDYMNMSWHDVEGIWNHNDGRYKGDYYANKYWRNNGYYYNINIDSKIGSRDTNDNRTIIYTNNYVFDVIQKDKDIINKATTEKLEADLKKAGDIRDEKLKSELENCPLK